MIHARIIEETGGAHGVRDVGLLQSAAVRPQTALGGQEMYKNLFEKAAALFEALARYHVFVDGNKRTAIGSAARFLFINGYQLTATNPELEKFVLHTVESRLEIPEIAAWLKKHSKRYNTRSGFPRGSAARTS